MKKYLILTKTLFQCGLSSSMEGSKKKGLRKSGGPLLVLLMAVCFMPMIAATFTGSRVMYPMLAANGAQDGILSMSLFLGAMLTLVFGFTMIISNFYTTSDLPILLAMPLRPSVIVAAKATICLGYEYLMIVIYTGPMLAGFGVAANASPAWWICMAVTCLLIPVIPISYCGIFSMIFMSVFHGVRNKHTLTIISMSIVIVMVIVISVFGQNITSMNIDALSNMTQNMSGLRYVFPQLILAVTALSEGNLLFLLLFILTVAATAAIFLLIGNALYFKGAVGMTESAQKKKKLSRSEIDSTLQARKPVISYAKVEWKKVLRSSTYFMNGVLIDLIWPLFFFIPFIGQFFGSAKDQESAGDLGTMFSFLTKNAGKGTSLAILLIILYGIIFFTAVFNFMTPSTISREGKGLWFMKTIPMTFSHQLRAKILGSLPVTVLTSIGYGLILCIIGVVNGMTPLVIFYMILMAVPSIALVNYVQLLFDLRWARLVWQNEAVPIKQNFHAMAATGVCFLLAGIPALGGIAMYLLLKINIHLIVGIVFVVLCILAFAFRMWLHEYGNERMSELP